MIERDLKHLIDRYLPPRKVIIIFGARQVGKTTLIRELVSTTDANVLWLNGDDHNVRESFLNATSTRLRQLIGNHGTVVIDEAQRIHEIGLALKLIHDNYPDIGLFVTGSSSLDLNDTIKESLTGRKWEFHLYPFSYHELSRHFNFFEMERRLPERLIFGCYPDVVLAAPGRQQEVLIELTDSYLFKDALALVDIRKPTQLLDLLKALAFQVGNEVSYNELAKTTGLDNETVLRYIDLLEQSFIIFRLGALSRNLRTEIRRSRKIYFHDNGILNTMTGNFNDLSVRNDVGALWENYLVSERIKVNHYARRYSHSYFWRTTMQQEIDYIEEANGVMKAFEFKWNPKRTVRFPKTFLKAYPGSETAVITPENYHEFLMLGGSIA